MERYIAIDNVCAWPNLTRMPDGAIIAAIFNQPCHGLWEGDAECWGSDDGGRTWRLRGTAASHEPGTNRGSCAAGLSATGDLIVFASGHTKRPPRGQRASHEGAVLLSPWVCRSTDGGRTWTVRDAFTNAPGPGMTTVLPFGDVVQAADGALCVSGYAGQSGGSDRINSAYLFRSYDDGLTWGDGSIIGQASYNETAPIHLGDGRWLAAVRTHPDDALHQFDSDDDGRTWRFSQELGVPGQHPAHLLRMTDGRVLLTYGNRCIGRQGIDIRISGDEGRTWGAPMQLVALEPGDLGYPGTVDADDGKLCTAWYSSGIAAHQRYHMGTLIWDVDEAERHWFSAAVSSWMVSDLTSGAAGIASAPCQGLATPLGWSRTQAYATDGFVNIHERHGDADGIVYLANRFDVSRSARWELSIGHDGGIRVFVDGSSVLAEPETRNPACPDRTQIEILLDRGKHEIVIAFDTAAGKGWGVFSSWVVPKCERKADTERVFPVPL